MVTHSYIRAIFHDFVATYRANCDESEVYTDQTDAKIRRRCVQKKNEQ